MWKDLTLQQKAEIMRMSVANGVTDINDIIALYDDSTPNQFDDGGFVNFYNSLPRNQRDSINYNVRRYWELNGKPKDFNEAVQRGMYTKQSDGWHANSVAYNEAKDEYEFMKSPTHPTTIYEIGAYLNNKDFQKEYYLDYTSKPNYKYRRKPSWMYNNGGHLYKGGGNKQQLGIIDSILTKHGVNYTKTSGYRGPNSKVGKLGSKSAHARTLSDGSSAAIDIVPGPGSSWDKLYAQMSSPEVRADLAKYGLDILDETSASTMKKTGATGKHFHVGKGIKGQQGKGVFVNQNNPTISAYHKMYGRPDLSISNDILYNPAQELKWTNITPTMQQTPWYNNVNSNLALEDFTPQVKPITPIPVEERFPIEELPDIAPLLSSILPDQRMPSYQQVTVPTYQSPIINFDEPYLLFGR